MYGGQCHTSIPFVGPHRWLSVLVFHRLMLLRRCRAALLATRSKAASNDDFDKEVQVGFEEMYDAESV